MKVDPVKQEKFDTGINTKFMDYIDVPASSKKDFKLAFFAYKESFTTMKVCSRSNLIYMYHNLMHTAFH